MLDPLDFPAEILKGTTIGASAGIGRSGGGGVCRPAKRAESTATIIAPTATRMAGCTFAHAVRRYPRNAYETRHRAKI